MPTSKAGFMKLGDFVINIYNLENKRYTYDFQVDDRFFQFFEDSIIKVASGTVHIDLDKQESFICLNFHLQGEIELVCDRSLERYAEQVDTHQKLIYRYGDQEKELGIDCYMIPKGHQQLQLAQHIYEFFAIEVPMKKIHPKFREEDYLREELIYTTSGENKAKNEQEVDPRWKELLKLKENNKLNYKNGTS